jgi:hypothetical protein
MIIRATIVTAIATEDLWDEDEAIVVIIACVVVFRILVIDVCKVYYFILMYGRYLLAPVQISLQLNPEVFGSLYWRYADG